MALGDLRPLAMALALHGLVALVLSALVPAPTERVGRWRPVGPPAAEAIAVELEWDLEAPAVEGRAPGTAVSWPFNAVAPSSAGRLAHRIVPGRPGVGGALVPEPAEVAESGEGTAGQAAGAPGASPAAPGGWSYGQPPPVGGLAPGLGGPALWALPGGMPPIGPGAPAPTAVPPRARDPHAANRALRAAVRRSDARKGLGLQAATTVASVLREAVRAHTPPVSFATFQARLDGAGRLVDVRVLSFSAGTVQMWRRAARQTRARLAARTFAMPADFADGALVTVHVQSEVQWPSGSGRAKPTVEREIEAPRWPYTPQPSPEGRSFRTPPWGPPPKDPLARFDGSDIGAHPTRVVYVRVDAQPLSRQGATTTAPLQPRM